jgi:rfaE bifunctional protein kinase chain/domain
MKIGICIGHFSLIHPGHHAFLSYAFSACDSLVIFVTDREGGSPTDTANFQKVVTQLEKFAFISNVRSIDELPGFLEEVGIANCLFFMGAKPRTGSPSAAQIWCERLDIDSSQIAINSGIEDYHRLYVGLDNSEQQIAKALAFEEAVQILNVIRTDLVNNLDRLVGRRCVVLGDVIVDRYVECEASGISSEGPLIVMSELSDRSFVGGAGLVALNLASLGVETSLAGVFRFDRGTIDVYVNQILESWNIDRIPVFDSPLLGATIKTRYLCERTKVFRTTKKGCIDKLWQNCTFAISKLEDVMAESFALILSDFSLGIFSSIQNCDVVLKTSRAKGVRVYVDSQATSSSGGLYKFKGCHSIFCTLREARDCLSMLGVQSSELGYDELGEYLLTKMDCQRVFLKLGENGFICYAIDRSEGPRRIFVPALVSDPIDATGAGDTFLSAVVVAESKGMSLEEACVFGALASACAVSTSGNMHIDIDKVKRRNQEIDLMLQGV